MKNCTGCKYAEWRKTTAGKMHPSGDGRCMYQYKIPPLPASMYWLVERHPSGGHINRKKDNKNDCVYYQRATI